MPERGTAAGGEADNRVAWPHVALGHRLLALRGPVLGAFDRAHQRPHAARDHALHLLGLRAEGGRAFRGIQHAEPPAGAGADVDQPPAALEPRDNEIDGFGQRLADAMHDLGHRAILGIDGVHDLERRRDVDALGARIALLGEAGVVEVGRGRGHLKSETRR